MLVYGNRHRVQDWPYSEITGKRHRTLIPSEGVIQDKEALLLLCNMAMETMVMGRQRLLGQQVLSVQRGMTFLQQQHLLMLTGLHMEIARLKQRCHDLSGELNSRCSDQSAADEEARRLSARCAAAERLLWERQGAVAAVRGELRAGRARASALGRSLREEERHFLDELKRRSHRITSLSRDLQRQTSVAKALSQELHHARIRLFEKYQSGGAEREPAGEGGAKGGTAGGVEEEEEEEGANSRLPSLPPLAPAQQVPEEAGTEAGSRVREERVRSEERHVMRSVREERVRACVPRESVSSPQRPRAMPDPALFLFPLRYGLHRWRRQVRVQARDREEEEEEEGPVLEDEWEDIDEGRVPRRVDMGAGEGETAL